MKKKINTSKKHQEQKRPGTEKQMKPTPETKPIYEKEEKKLANKVAIITGGDSGIGKYHGKASFDVFSHYKSVLKRDFVFDMKVLYPPYAGKLPLLKKLFGKK